jgi:hypothetical protein
MSNLRATVFLRRETQAMGRPCHLINFIEADPYVIVMTYEVEPFALKDENKKKQISQTQRRVAIYCKKRGKIGSFIIEVENG